MSRPVSLTIAVVLQWVAALAALIAGLTMITAAFELSDDATKSALEQALSGQGVTDVTGRQIVIGVFMAGVIVVGLSLLRVILALYLARGRNWARMIITILVFLNILAGVAYLFQEDFWRGIPTIVLELVVLWLLFNARSNAFISERSAS